MLIIVLMNSWCLGVNIGMGTTYATLLEAPPYNWGPKWVGVAQAGQIVVRGEHELESAPLCFLRYLPFAFLAETDLIPLALPVALGVLSTVFFGAGYAHPEKFH